MSSHEAQLLPAPLAPDRREPATTGRARWLIAAAIVAAATLAVYGRVATFAFVAWDDPINVTQNPYLNPPTLFGTAQFWGRSYAGLYIPVTYTFFALEARLAEQHQGRQDAENLNSAFFHVANLLLHVASALLVLKVLSRLVDHAGAACLGALLFAIHPLQVEPVAWVTETKGLLAGLFSLAALDQYLAFAQAAVRATAGAAPLDTNPRHRRRHYLLATIFFGLALLSKPIAAGVPLVAGVLDLALVRRRGRNVLWALLPWCALAGLVLAGTKSLQPDESLAVVPVWWARPFIAADAVAFYLAKLCFPILLAADYGRSPQTVLASAYLYWIWLLPAGVAVALASLSDRRAWLAALAVFIAGLAPVLGLVPFTYQRFSTVADRYAYLALLGPALALAWLLSRHWHKAPVFLCGLLLAVLAGRSFAQTEYWRESGNLFRHALAVNPRSLVAQNGLGNLLAAEGRWDEAAVHYRRAVSIDPDSYSAHFNLGRAMAELDLPQEALAEYAAALRLRPDYGKARVQLARLLVREGRVADAIGEFQQLLRASPRDALLYHELGEAYSRQRNYDEAAASFRRAVELAPGLAGAHFNLAQMLALLGKRREAIDEYREVLRLNPGDKNAQQRLAEVLAAEREAGQN